MDEVTGNGSAEPLDDGSIEIAFADHNGDEAILEANESLPQQSAERLSLLRRPCLQQPSFIQSRNPIPGAIFSGFSTIFFAMGFDRIP